MDVELLENMLYVNADSLARDIEPSRDGALGEPLGKEGEDFLLSRRQAQGASRRGLRPSAAARQRRTRMSSSPGSNGFVT